MAHTLAALLRRIDSVAPDPATDAALLHKYATTGTKTITIVIVDSTGVTTTVKKKVKVKS